MTGMPRAACTSTAPRDNLFSLWRIHDTQAHPSAGPGATRVSAGETDAVKGGGINRLVVTDG